MIESRREYKQQMARVEAQRFEAGASDGKPVWEITGEDAAAFCEELLRSASTYTDAACEAGSSNVIHAVKCDAAATVFFHNRGSSA
ncbi:DUF1048 domain-containing protein [Paenibacillus mucilaginosus]|uniref:DUF1048 domain-containing protein n=1 Tax=Paenibacillus mucilaginosus TaxID=61624 RepID=UPI003D1F001D